MVDLTTKKAMRWLTGVGSEDKGGAASRVGWHATTPDFAT